MPTATYRPLATITLGTATSSITFASIPATYRDLVITATVAAGFDARIRLNGDTGANYSRCSFVGNGNETLSVGGTGDTSLLLSRPDYLGMSQIMDYSATDKHKSALGRDSNAQTDTVVDVRAHRWLNTAAITSIVVFGNGGNLAAGSTFNLYGIVS